MALNLEQSCRLFITRDSKCCRLFISRDSKHILSARFYPRRAGVPVGVLRYTFFGLEADRMVGMKERVITWMGFPSIREALNRSHTTSMT